ncbi:hypothetical protein [Jeotgalibacillus sp. JSM ZJ347]
MLYPDEIADNIEGNHCGLKAAEGIKERIEGIKSYIEMIDPGLRQ